MCKCCTLTLKLKRSQAISSWCLWQSNTPGCMCKPLWQHVWPAGVFCPLCPVWPLCPRCPLTLAPPVFSRPNWPCRSSWPRLWQLASCPVPSPSQLCARWPPTHWLCATQWAPPPSSRPPSWAQHCSGLLRGHCGPHTPPSSSPLTEDFTCSPSDFSLPSSIPQALLEVSHMTELTRKLCSQPDSQWSECTSPDAQ